jgi:hypothetical protein
MSSGLWEEDRPSAAVTASRGLCGLRGGAVCVGSTAGPGVLLSVHMSPFEVIHCSVSAIHPGHLWWGRHLPFRKIWRGIDGLVTPCLTSDLSLGLGNRKWHFPVVGPSSPT